MDSVNFTKGFINNIFICGIIKWVWE